MKKDIFNVERFINLILRNLALDYKSWLTSIASVVGAFIGIAVLGMIFSSSSSSNWISSYQTQVSIAFMIMGLIFASYSFAELKTPTKSLQYLSLAASNLEKFLVAYLFGTVFYILVSAAAYSFGSIVISVISMLFFNGSFEIYNPFSNEFLKILFMFLNLHAIFFLGSIWFKSNAFFKTILSMFVINIITISWVSFLTFLMFNKQKSMYLDGFSFNFYFLNNLTNIETIKSILLVFWVLVSIFLIYTAYIRFKEKEV